MTGRYPGTPDPEGVYRPILYVFVIAPSVDQMIRTEAIVDSGADRTTVPYELVKVLTDKAWDDLGESPPWRGLGGEQEMKVTDLTVAWPTPKDVFCKEVVVTPADVPVLLGRSDFFRRWAVRFNWQHTPPYPPWFEVQKVSTKPPPEARGRGSRR